MKHILFVLDYYLPHSGGIENVFENLITRLLRDGYKISVLTSHYDSNLPSVEHRGHLTIHRTGSGRLSFLFCAIKKGIGILKSHKIDIIHASTYGGAIPGSILGMIFKKKVILTVHEVFGKLWNIYKGTIGGCLYRWFERSIFWFPYDVYHCVSRYTMNSLRVCYGISDNKLKMIYNGVDYDFWNAEKVSKDEVVSLRKKYGRENKFVVLYYGHAGKSKGIDALIEAMPGILDLDENIVMVFNLIESKRTEEMKERIKNLTNPPSASLPPPFSRRPIQIFNGFEKEELRRLVASVDCVVAPSISEGFGSVHTEVCAMGRPLSATDVASIPEVVWGNVKFVSPGNAGEIVEAVKELYGATSKGLQPLVHDMGTEIPQKIFLWENMLKEIEKLY